MVSHRRRLDSAPSVSEEESSGHYDEFWATNKPTTRYYYDGQMSFEDDYTVIAGGFGTPQVTVTRYALGARGIDGIETTTTQGASVVYPIYDGHGNMTCTLSRSGLSFSRSNDREYGAWGDIRSGSGGDQGYVANLGHRRDAESGLTYMRARYYEPGTGRFVSQDSARSGSNFFAYADNCPTNLVDRNGKDAVAATWYVIGLLFFVIGHVLLGDAGKLMDKATAEAFRRARYDLRQLQQLGEFSGDIEEHLKGMSFDELRPYMPDDVVDASKARLAQGRATRSAGLALIGLALIYYGFMKSCDMNALGYNSPDIDFYGG